MATEEHKELSTFIKGVHQKLRLESQKQGADEAWAMHCKQQQVLMKYATSMMLLATQCWDSNNRGSEKCRVQWVISQAEEYFMKTGQHTAEQWENAMNKKLFGFVVPSEDCNSIRSKKSDVLNVLDVGSCYNPFKICPFFNVLAVDLAPATIDVIQCDFLSAEIVSSDYTNITSPCKQLPENTFDIVVFSLLLEYMPCSEQRYLCCAKAYKLLKVSGVLFILTPDSKHESANSKVMKSWRIALASIGYWRICYKKLRHLHCMIFRKCKNPAIPRHLLVKYNNCIPEKCVYIPQDFHEYTDKNEEKEKERGDTDNKVIADSFTELPDGDAFS